MKKHSKLLALIMSVAMILTIVPITLFASAEASPLSGGLLDGVKDYTISTPEELKTLADKTNAGNNFDGYTFTLTADIDIAGYPDWEPIGNKDTRTFAGTFNGAGFGISNLTITDEAIVDGESTYEGGIAGLFGYVEGDLNKVVLRDAEITIKGTNTRVGNVAAYLLEGATITDSTSLGGVINVTNNSEKLNTNYVGGLVGYNTGTIQSSYSRDNIYVSAASALNNVGGVVGNNYMGASVEACYFAGSISIGDSLLGAPGGIAGANQANIKNSYNAGIIGGIYSSGIAGLQSSEAMIENCYYLEDSAQTAAHKYEDGNFVAYADNNSIINSQVFTLDDKVAASELNTGLLGALVGKFEEPVLGSEYPFPVLKDNTHQGEPAPDTINFAGGNGTLYNPYIVQTTTHLSNVRMHLASAYKVSDGSGNATTIVFKDAEYGSATENLTAVLASAEFTAFVAELNADTDIPYTTAGGGTGTVTDFDTAQAAIDSIVTGDDQELVQKKATYNDRLQGFRNQAGDGSFKDGFIPIGTMATPFFGVFDGNGSTISNLQINTNGAVAAMFASNYGTILDLTLTDSTVNLVGGDSTANAASVAGTNNGLISNVKTDTAVTVNSDVFLANAAGLAAVNNGTIENSTNTGIIKITHTDAAFAAQDVDYSKIAAEAKLNAAGIAAVNNGVVTGCASLDTARTMLTSASTTDGIVEDKYVATGNAAVSSASDPAATSKPYLEFNLNNQYSHNNGLMVAGDKDAGIIACGTLYNGSASGAVTYGTEINNNYQKVDVAYGSEEVTFLVWMEIDTSTIKANCSAVNREFLVGDKFSSSGIEVTATNAGREVNLREVASAADNGYVVTVYDKDGAVVPVDDFSNAKSGTYYVAVTYSATVLADGTNAIGTIPGGVQEYTYEIEILDIDSLTITPDFSTYMGGQTPTMQVKAVYENGVTKSFDNYEYFIADDAAATEGTLAFAEPASAVKNYIVAFCENSNGEKVYSNSAEVTVYPSNVAVTNLQAIVNDSANAPKNLKDNIKLTWEKVAGATDYTVYRKDAGAADDTYKRVKVVTELVEDPDVAPTYTDTRSKSGSSYDYKVVVNIAGQASTGSTTKTSVTAGVIQSVTVDAEKAKKYFALDSSFGVGSLRVNGKYMNGDTEYISYTTKDSAEATTLQYTVAFYNETNTAPTTFDSSAPSKYRVRVLWKGAEQQITNGTDANSYGIEVCRPTELKFSSARYSAYPVGYPKADFLNTLTVNALYDSTTGLGSKRVKAERLDSNNYESLNGAAGEKTINLNHTVLTDLSTTCTIKFVPNVAPEGVIADAQANGTNKITWNAVNGAVSYNVYRGTDSAFDIASGQLLKNLKELEFVDETAIAGTTYYYKVAAVIADQETPLSDDIAQAITKSPTYIKADTSGVKLTEYAIGDKLSITGLKVYAYYYLGTETPDYAKISDANEFEKRELVYTEDPAVYGYTYTSDFNNVEAGTYTVTVTVGGADTYNSQAIGSYTVQVYPVYKITVATRESGYPVGYEFGAADLLVKVVYGEEGKDVMSKETDLFEIVVAPNTASTGVKKAKVVYSSDENMTAECQVAIYDPAAAVVLTAAQGETGIDLEFSPSLTPGAEYFIIYRNESSNKAPAESSSSYKVKVENKATDGTVIVTDESKLTPGKTYYYQVVPVYPGELKGGASNIVSGIAPISATIKAKAGSGYAMVSGKDWMAKIQPGTAVSTFINNLENSSYIKVYNAAGKQVTSGKVGTGYVAKLIINGSVQDTVTIVVLGDTNGDATINVQDVKKTLNQSLGKSKLTGVYLQAGDVNADGKVNVQDVKKTLNVSIGKATKY